MVLAGGLGGVHSANLVSANEPPAQGTPSTETANEVGTATGAQEPASPAMAPTMQEESAPPAGAGDIQERGLHQGTTPGLPQGGTASGPPSNFQAPTPSLTAVANAIRVTSKSVSVNLRVPANAPVTVPVEISVAYISPVHAGRLTKTYAPSTGTIILYHEAEGDRKPRPMRLDISLRELIPNGRTFSFSRQFTVVPLFDITISSLRFSIITQCDLITPANDIRLRWLSPDNRLGKSDFGVDLQERKVIREFAWDVKGISTDTGANLKEPRVIFHEDSFAGDYQATLALGRHKLLDPGQPEFYSFILKENEQGPPGSPSPTGCYAKFEYHIGRKLLTFDQF
jgi:hypothetical protein